PERTSGAREPPRGPPRPTPPRPRTGASSTVATGSVRRPRGAGRRRRRGTERPSRPSLVEPAIFEDGHEPVTVVLEIRPIGGEKLRRRDPPLHDGARSDDVAARQLTDRHEIVDRVAARGRVRTDDRDRRARRKQAA